MKLSRLPKPVRLVLYGLATLVEWLVMAIRMGAALSLVGVMIVVIGLPLILLIMFGVAATEEYLAASNARAASVTACSRQYKAPGEILACRQLREDEPIFWNAMDAAWGRAEKAIEEF